MVGPCEFVHDVFFCSKCSKQIEFVTQLSFEDVDIYIKKLKKKYFKKGIDLEIKKSYELKDGQQVDEFGQIEDIQHVCLSGCKDGEKLFVCKIPMLRKNRWERPYYFKISAKKFIK